jgi:hypothetical protein
VLIVALLVASFIALLLGGYLSLNLGTARLAQRGFDRGAAFHLAEAGLEEGLWTYNRILAGEKTPWAGWQTGDGVAWRRIDGFALTGATTGSVKLHASPLAPVGDARPTIVALATVQTPGAPAVHQMVEVTLRRRSFFAAGLVALERLAFNGVKSTFDSWNSDPDGNPATPPVPYSKTVALDTGTVASAATQQSQLRLDRARIHGYYRGTGIVPIVGSQGGIGSFSTPAGEIDLARISGDFRAHFPFVNAPTDGVFLASIGSTLGTAGETTSWRAASLDLRGQKTLTILGHVTLVLTAPVSALALSGQAAILIPDGSSLTLYTAGDIQIGGGGVANNPARPSAFQIWSTAREASRRGQTIAVTGGASLSAVLYAPSAAVTISGNGDIFGAIVARTVVFNGSAAFHYDESLRFLDRHAAYRGATWRTIDDPAEREALLPLVDR